MDLKTEEELVRLAKEDNKAFAKLYDFYYPKIYNYVLRRTGKVEVTLDITSVVFFKAITRLKKFTWRGISFSSWIYKIATNEIYNYLRGKKRSPISLNTLLERADFEPASLVDIQEEIIEVEEQLMRQKDFQKIQQKLLSLPIHYQEVIALRFFEQKKIREISVILGKNEGTIKSLVSRGVVLLRKDIAPKSKKKNTSRNKVVQPFPKLSVIKVQE